MEEDHLHIAAPRAEAGRPARQLLIPCLPPRGELQRGAPDPAIDRIGFEAPEPEEQGAVRDLGPDARQIGEYGACFFVGSLAQSVPWGFHPCDLPRRLQEIGSPKTEPRLPKRSLPRPRELRGGGERVPRGTGDGRSPAERHALHAAADLPDVRGGRGDEGRKRLPGVLLQEPQAEEGQDARERAELLRVIQPAQGVLVEAEVSDEGLPARVLSHERDREVSWIEERHRELGPSDDPPPGVPFPHPAECLPARKREVEVDRSGDGKVVAHGSSVAWRNLPRQFISLGAGFR